MICYCCAHAQQNLHGKVIDSTGTGIEFVTVAVLNSNDSSVVESTLSNTKGEFNFILKNPGNYFIKAFLVGYSEMYLKINENDNNLPPLILKNGGVNLNEVTVSTLKKLVEFKNGNITVNIENSPLAQGNSVFDLLSRLPGVTVDENNTISIQGKEGVKILIDDRVQQLSGAQLINLLKSMNASTIEKIEVLKNPPLKYDAAGTGGLINIKTKKVKIVGFSGALDYSYSQGFYDYQSGDLSLNYRGKKIIFYSTITVDKRTTFHDHRFYKKIVTDTQTTIMDQKMANFDGGNYLGGRMGLDWLINSKNTIGFKMNMEGGVGFEKNIGNTYLSDNDLGFTRLRFNSYVNNPWNYSNFNINAEHLFDTLGTKLIFSTDYSPNFDIYNGTYDNWFLNNNGDETTQPLFYINSNTIKSDILSSKLDFIKKTKKSATIETGIKAVNAEMKSSYDLHNKNNNTGEYSLDTTFTNAFTYNEQTLAGYLSLTKEWDGFSLNGGVRGENTHIVAESRMKDVRYTRDYFNLFPAANLQYNKNENHNFQLSYNRRIDRPGYNSFNPFRNRTSVFMSNKGNPNLLPEYSNTFELSHTFKGILSNSFSYSLIDHFLLDMTLQNDSSRETTAYVDNISKGVRYAYSVFYNQSVKKWWTITFNGAASYLNVSGKLLGQDYKSNGYFYMVSLTNQFLVKKTKIELNAKYIGPRFNGVWFNGPRWGVSLAIKRSFFNEKLNVMMGVDDIFFTMIGSNRIKVQNQDWKITATNDSRRFKVSLNYNFGKVKVQERDVISNEEEKGRLGK
jgi:hypothetical protein